MAHVNTETK